MSVAAINLLHERRASSEKYSCLGADCGARSEHGTTLSFRTHTRLRNGIPGSDWQVEPESEEGARIFALVAVEVRRPPLVRDRVVETPIAVHVGCCDPAADQRLVERKLCGGVVKAPIRSAHEEGIV